MNMTQKSKFTSEQAAATDRLVYEHIPIDFGTDRNRLVEILDMPRTTVYDALVRLADAKNPLIINYKAPPCGRGRPKSLWQRLLRMKE